MTTYNRPYTQEDVRRELQGKIWTTEQLREHFGYPPTRNIRDTPIFRLLVRVKGRRSFTPVKWVAK